MSGTFTYSTLSAGQSQTVTFTLKNSGGSATSALKVALAGSSAFKVTADSCSGTSLGPAKSCSVSVAYSAPGTPGATDQATLTATSNKPVATASLTLKGTVAKVTPAISTSQQPASATVGGWVADNATVSGGSNPSGTVTFNLYNNSNGAGTPLLTSTETLSGGNATSESYATTGTGTDYWVATYNGNSANNSVSSGVAGEPVTITQASPSISTSQQQSSATVGSAISDQATVSGGFSPTGTVTFNLYTSDTTQNSTTLLFTDTESLSGGSATSASYTTIDGGTDYWVATYSGDQNNTSVTSGTASEPVTISGTVCQFGCPYVTVQSAIDAVENGTISNPITVGPGDYRGVLFVTGTVTIDGAGDTSDPTVSTILDGFTISSVIMVEGNLTLSGVEIANGDAQDEGGGIDSTGIVTFAGAVSITNNTVSGSSGVGGGISNSGGTLTFASGSNVSITNNTAAFEGGGIENSDLGTVTLEAGSTVTISGNTAGSSSDFDGFGGGISNSGGTLTFDSGSTAVITNNTAGLEGGGINDSGTVTYDAGSNATITGNMPDDCAPTTSCPAA